MDPISDDQLLQYLVQGYTPAQLKKQFKFSDQQLITALLRNPMALGVVQERARETASGLTRFNPNRTYGTGILPFEAIINPTEQKYEYLGQVSKDYFDAVAKNANNPEAISKLNEKYLDENWLQQTYGQAVDTSAMITDTPNFLDDEQKRNQAASESNYNEFVRSAKDSGLLDDPSMSPLQAFFSQNFDNELLGTIPNVDATWAQALGVKGKPVKYQAPTQQEQDALVAEYANRAKETERKRIEDYVANATQSQTNKGRELAEAGVTAGSDPTELAKFYAGREMEGILSQYADALKQASERESKLSKESQSNVNRYMNYLLGGTTPYIAAANRALGITNQRLG